MGSPELIVDPEISLRKFNRELAQYRSLEASYLERGWFLLNAEFPEIFIVFATEATSPPAVVFGAIINFENYDYWAPSVSIVNPFTRVPYLAKELPVRMVRAVGVPQDPGALEQLPPGMLPPGMQVQNLLQYHSPEEKPFLCLPGVREYHDHPAHTADSWLLHRGRGEGTLNFLLENMYTYGVKPIAGFQVQQLFKIQFGANNIPQ